MNGLEMYHHGIKGQRWGIRRFQNEDGSLTKEGRERRLYRDRTVRAAKSSRSVDSIINTMSSDEKHRLAIEDGEEYLTFEQGSQVAKRILQGDKGKTPVAFFDLLEDGKTINVSLGTRSGEEYRGKGYATKAAQKGLKWYEQNKEKYGYDKIVWGVRTDNEASIRIAKKLGFKMDKNSYSKDRKWVNYEK